MKPWQEIVYKSLNIKIPSLRLYANVQPENFTLKRILVQNQLFGSTFMFNPSLLAICKNIPENAVSHDWWIALYAAAFGKIVYINEPLVKYRQHESNTVGAKSGRVIDLIKQIKSIRDHKFDTQKSYYQAQEFLTNSEKFLNDEKRKIISSYGNFAIEKKPIKIAKIIFGGYTKKGLVNKFIQLINY